MEEKNFTTEDWSRYLSAELERSVSVRYGRAKRQVIVAFHARSELRVRMNAVFGNAPGDVREAVADWLRSGKRAKRACRRLDDWIADVAEPLEADALDDAAVRDVEAGDQTRERHRSRKREPAAPLFSGWNWTPRKLPDSATATTPSERAVSAGVSAAYECAK